ncbi:zinc-binding alcohol dehydrogenase family protein [Rhodoligotrophos appendicifer]|uniref:zinc-binding alcohol dehydrogenase family protein n=1 Tax=Rhodoligotrophos appendicifer TaxID=987056 RepID=UPI00118545D2|nr:zinc-binding alcohol dehydrogenase family protein [Rhodoligotrophos appendicifer]
MKAVGVFQSAPITDLNCLVDVELPIPALRARDLLVRVEAISVNPVDTKVRRFRVQERLEQPRILGFDGAGTVERVGAETTLFKVGDRVFFAGDITRNGSNAQYVPVDERIVGPCPTRLSFAEAAALPLTALTAAEALHDRMGLSRQPEDNSGRSLLIIGGAGGVGSIAIQLAKQAGLTVIATASRPETRQWCQDLGADFIANHKDLAVSVRALGFDCVDSILCASSTDDYFPITAELATPQGVVCFIVANEKPINAALYQSKSVTLAWEYMFTRAQFSTPDIAEQNRILTDLAKAIDQGEVRTTLTTTLGPINAANLRKAHELVEGGRMIGKVVVEGFEG